MKKILCLTLAVFSVLAFTACGAKEEESDSLKEFFEETTEEATTWDYYDVEDVTESVSDNEHYEWYLNKEELAMKEKFDEESVQVLYHVRKTAYDAESQLGAFADFNNAKRLADANRQDGYEVYDTNGSMVYNPNEDVSDGQIRYRVRKSAYDAESQLGAFSLFDNAKEVADAYKYEGYEVYDMNGNMVYVP